LTAAGRELVLLGPPHIPDPTGWEQLGIDMRRVLIVRTPRPADRLWAIEQSLKSAAFGALLAWLPEEKTLARHDALRRLQLAASSANGLTFLMRPAAAQFHASPAPLRLTLSTGKPEGARRTLSVRLLKRRGPVLAAPLSLMLPEIHRGMKAFSLVEREIPSIDTATVATSGDSHALAGALLSDAGA
jgi:protein ImuA